MAGAASIDRGEAVVAIPLTVRPYAPGWLHILLRRLDELPGPALAAYVVIGAVQSLVFHLIPWSKGTASVGQLDTINVYWGVLLALLLWVAAWLERVAASAVDTSRPALRLGDDAVARLRYEMSVAPAGPSAIAALAAAGLTLLQFVVDPVGSSIVGLAAPLVVAAFVGQVVSVSILLVLLLQLVRQVRLVRRTLEHDANVDPFLPGPLNAFSRLTSRAGIAVVLLTTSGFLVVPPSEEWEAFLVTSAPYLVVPSLIAALAFVVPAYGFHQRLVDAKDRLQDETEVRLKRVLADLNRDVDAGDLGRAEGMNKTLDSLLRQREVIAKLPTWPWSTGSLRAVVTAILLPLFLFVIQLLITRFL